jgi:hypothetical protein
MHCWLLSLVLAVFAADARTAESKLPPEVFRTWFHSFEEDPAADGPRPIQVFRPRGYSFPRARGRGGFELREDGVFVSHEPGRGDRGESTEGKWTAPDATRIVVSFPEQERRTCIQIVSLTAEQLRVRRWQE